MRAIVCPNCGGLIDMGHALPAFGSTIKSMVTGEFLVVDCRSCETAVFVEPTVTWRVGLNPRDFFDSNNGSVLCCQDSQHKHSCRALS